MLFLVIGRTGSGKDYLVDKLKEKGLTQVKSYATRPKRTEDEDTHIFIEPNEFDNYPNKVAHTKINGYDYFATAEQIDESDIYVIDPNGLYELVERLPDETFHIVYVMAEDTDRRINAVRRADDKIKEEQIFEARDAAENEQFTAFEKRLETLEGAQEFGQNVTCVYRYPNIYDADATAKYVEFLYDSKIMHDKMTALVKEALTEQIVEIDENDSTKVIVKTENGETISVPIEHFADVVLGSEQWTSILMLELMRKSPRFSDI